MVNGCTAGNPDEARGVSVLSLDSVRVFCLKCNGVVTAGRDPFGSVGSDVSGEVLQVYVFGGCQYPME